LALDRNLANAHSIIGLGKVFLGRAGDSEAHIIEALRLSPRDTIAYIWMTNAGLAKLHLGGWEQAAAWFRRAIEANRNNPHPQFLLSAGVAQLGRLNEAHTAVEVGLAINPSFTISRARAAWRARRRSNIFKRTRADSRRPAESRSPRIMTAASPPCRDPHGRRGSSHHRSLARASADQEKKETRNFLRESKIDGIPYRSSD
jgi:tetratricopeptide (TPR) repeat protein